MSYNYYNSSKYVRGELAISEETLKVSVLWFQSRRIKQKRRRVSDKRENTLLVQQYLFTQAAIKMLSKY